jgi:AcrR family transcriptional regulator
MAKKRQQRKTTASRASAAPADRVIDAALGLAESRGWRGVTLADIAAETKMSLADLYALYPSKAAILSAFVSRIDRATLAGVDVGGKDGSVRDRLFDIIMRRLDALAPHKGAIAAIVPTLARHPLGLLCTGARLCRSIAWMAGAAGVDTTGPLGALRVQALTALYLFVLRTWLGDDGDDHAKTMAALDKSLKRAEMMAQTQPLARFRSAAG